MHRVDAGAGLPGVLLPGRVLLDLGNGALGPLQRYTSLLDLDAVLVSHTHADHCLDLCSLYVGRYYDPRLGPPGSVDELLPVHGPAGTGERIRAAYGDPGHLDLGRVFAVHAWKARVPVSIGRRRPAARRGRLRRGSGRRDAGDPPHRTPGR